MPSPYDASLYLNACARIGLVDAFCILVFICLCEEKNSTIELWNMHSGYFLQPSRFFQNESALISDL